MSFILDALKKSEAERQRQAGPALLEMRIVRPARRLPPWAIVVGVLLVACVLALAWVALRRGGAAAPATAAAVSPATTVTNSTLAAGAVGTPAAGPPAAAAPGAAAPGASAPIAGAPIAGAPIAAPGAAVTPGMNASPLVASGGEDNPADVAPAEAPSASAARERAETSGLRNYSELGGRIPELRLDLHVYATKPQERYAFINMHKLREGDVTPEGVTVKEITPDGVVLEYQGTEFLLGR